MGKHTSEDAYYERLRNLANVNRPQEQQTSRTLGTLIDYQKAVDGINYGIIKEGHKYYVKKGGTIDTPDVSDFTYIGGLENITTYQYKSLAEADKQRNMILQTINEGGSVKMKNDGKKVLLKEDTAEKEIEMAASKADDLDAATASDIPTEEPPVEEPIGDVDAPAEKSLADLGAEGEPLPEPAPEGGEEPIEGEPEGDGGEEPIEGEPEGEETAPAGAEGADEDNLTVIEIEKDLGKLSNKVRKTNLTTSQVKSYVNSFLAAFKDKFMDVEIEDRKAMADKILKVLPDDSVDELPDGDVNEGGCNECGTFAKYAESRGYNADSIIESSDEEISNLVSGYATAHEDGMNDGDFQCVAVVATPNAVDTLKTDYGHEDYAEKLTPYVNTVNEEEGFDRAARIQELFGGVADPANIETQPNTVQEDEEDDTLGIEDIPTPEPELPIEEPVAELPVSSGSGVEVNVDGNTKTVNVTMNESEKKIRKYVINRLQEITGQKRSTLNEDAKSESLKRLDRIIQEQYDLHIKTMKKGGSVNEVFGLEKVFGYTVGDVKRKLATLSPTDTQGVEELFRGAFSEPLTNPKMGVLKRAAATTPTEEKFTILQQYVDNNGGTIRLTSDNRRVQYAPKSVSDKAKKSPFAPN